MQDFTEYRTRQDELAIFASMEMVLVFKKFALPTRPFEWSIHGKSGPVYVTGQNNSFLMEPSAKSNSSVKFNSNVRFNFQNKNGGKIFVRKVGHKIYLIFV